MYASTFLIAALASIVSAGGHGYGNSTTASTSSHAVTSSGSLSSSSSSYVHSSTPASSSASLTLSSKSSSSASVTSHSSLTTYTTVTTCPITYTRHTGSSVEYSTGYTTSTLTVTSCKGGCTAAPPPHTTTPPPQQSSYPAGPVWVTDTITKFVPCSTPVTDSNGKTIYYSTWLTASYIPTTYVTTYTQLPPPPPVKSASVCPPEVTVTETVYVTVGAPAHPTSSVVGNGGNGGKPETSTKIDTQSQGGYSETTSKSALSSTKTYLPPSGTGTGSKPSGTGSGPKSTDSKTWSFPTPSAHKKW